jgi:hypothetical protein
MKTRNRWFVFVLALGLMLPAGLPLAAELAPGGTFIDDDGLVHEPDIEAIFAAGITQGCSSTQFCPDQAVTRGQMAAFLTRGLALPAATSSPFSDSAGQFQDDINRLAASGITTGCGGDLFCPNDAVSRGQMAAFLNRALDLPAATTSPFSDSAGQFQDDIDRLAASGITTGCGGGRFCPNDPATRAQMATFLTRGLGLTPIIPPPRPQPLPGNPDGNAPIPAEAATEDTSNPTTVIGTGTPAGCTAQAVVDAVAAGGVITFNCGSSPVTIVMTLTAKVFNNAGPGIVIDGGGLVTLSGGGVRRILYMNTCDPAQEWTTSHCNNQDHPQLTVQNLTFIDGNSTGEDYDGGGGGAIFVRGGHFKIVNSTFLNNRCDEFGPDVGEQRFGCSASTTASRSTSLTAPSPETSAPTVAVPAALVCHGR